MMPKKVSTKNSKSNGATRKKSKRATPRSAVTGRFIIVTPRSDGWAVARQGGKRSRLFDTKVEAVTAATKTARNSGSELIIRGADGRIREVSTSRADSLMLGVWKSTSKAGSKTKRR